MARRQVYAPPSGVLAAISAFEIAAGGRIHGSLALRDGMEVINY
jgi:hypothetical protein